MKIHFMVAAMKGSIVPEFAWLMGQAWAAWRGAWASESCLRCDSKGWSLEIAGREVDRWPDFGNAMAELWHRRSIRDQRPWAIGWAGYEACAKFAGGLPSRTVETGALPGLFLIEPRRIDESAITLREGAIVGSRLDVSIDDTRFRERVNRILQLIASGEIYQVNLTRRFCTEWSGGIGQLVETAARHAPPYLSWFSGDGYDLLCTSMELLLRKCQRRLVTEPIKGTRPRGSDPDRDRALIAELESDLKERAELAMVVDLERNDLGRVAKEGTVRVTDSGSVFSYQTVHHRVARVEADAPATLPWWKVVEAMVPGGSVTGCPKWAAMETILELEPVARGPYTGALGVIAGSGDLELALPIRTAWKTGQELSFAAGCGIVWGSDPEREQIESRIKVGPWLDVVSSDRSG